MKPTFSLLTSKLLAHPAVWIALTALFLALDLTFGPAVSFPVAFVFPVALAAWHRGFRWGIFFAIGQPLLRLGLDFFRETPWSDSVSLLNCVIRAAVLCVFAWLVAQTVQQRRHIAALERLLPICAWCKKVCDEEQKWQPLDQYLADRADVSVTHGICPECMRKQVAELAKR